MSLTMPAAKAAELRFGVGGREVPTDLAQRRLPISLTGRLPLDVHRFVPRNDEELLSSVFT